MSSAPFLTPGSGRVRARIERRAAVVVVWLAHQPRLVPPVVVVAVFLAGALLPGIAGAVLLLLVAALMGLLSYLAWPSVPPALRGVRLLVLVGVTAFAVAKLV